MIVEEEWLCHPSEMRCGVLLFFFLIFVFSKSQSVDYIEEAVEWSLPHLMTRSRDHEKMLG